MSNQTEKTAREPVGSTDGLGDELQWIKDRPAIDGWYWYRAAGFEPEIVRVSGIMAASLCGCAWRLTGMSGKWAGPLSPPNAELTHGPTP